MGGQEGAPGIRLAEVVACLSVGSDLGKGLPMEQAMRTCVLSTALADLAGLPAEEARVVYYVSLLRFVGCVATAHDFAAVFGDDIAVSSWFLTVDAVDLRQVLRTLVAHVGAGQGALGRARALARALQAGPKARVLHEQASCEVARLMAERLGLGPDVQLALGQVFERWDGKGVPGASSGAEIARSVRVSQVAHYAELFHRAGGTAEAVAMVQSRAGRVFDPDLARLFGQHAADLLAALPEHDTVDAVLAAEPPPQAVLVEVDAVEAAFRVMADFVDLKSAYTAGHSRGVGDLSGVAARTAGLGEADVVLARRAGWLHDLGRSGVSTGIWDKPGPLGDQDWEQVRLHPYLTERVTSRFPRLAALGAVASGHHERVDGSGYHRGSKGRPPAVAGIVAAADVYQALLEDRPHRARRSPADASAVLGEEAGAGRLDESAVAAVLAAAGQRAPRGSRPTRYGLTDRELDVLALVARGLTNRRIGETLYVSPKTVNAHLEHIYTKIGVTTRAAATAFAMGHDLLASPWG